MVAAAAVLVDDMVPFPVVGGGHGRWEKANIVWIG